MLRIAAFVGVAAAACPYTSLTGSRSILAADASCPRNACFVNRTCGVLDAAMPDDENTVVGVDAIGDLTNYQARYLDVENVSTVNIKYMKLPETVKSLYFENIGQLDLGQLTTPLSSALVNVQFVNCSLGVIPIHFQWPKSLQQLVLMDNSLQTIPKGLPPSLVKLAIQSNALTDFNYLPTGLSQLNLQKNAITQVIDQDFSSIGFLALGLNPIKSFVNNKLSASLSFFVCNGCPITNFIVDQSSFDALNRLKPWNQDRSVEPYVGFFVNQSFASDPAACQAARGSLQDLWKGLTNLTFQACVVGRNASGLSGTTTSPLTSPPSSSSNTGVIIGLVVAGVVVAAIALFLLCRKKRAQPRAGSTQYQAYTPVTPEPTVGPVRPDPAPARQPAKRRENASGTGTQTGSLPSASSGSDQAARVLDSDTILDVSALRSCKLEFKDLALMSQKPLAAGAFGEVWLGLYGSEKVAIKRVKDRTPASVGKFIDEIKLMAKMESEYIVQFIGASWRRPIDMECVVEYMDLGDLRSYLVNHPPATFPWPQKFASIVSIVRGLIYLHTFNPPIIHRDLKSRNVLLDSKKGTKLTDFGASREIDESTLTNGIGTYQWMAPEIIVGTEYTIAADIYSFGILLSEFSTHLVPYSDLVNPSTNRPWNQQYILTNVTTGKLQPTFDTTETPAWVRDLAAQCLATDPADRPTSLQVAAVLQRVQ